MSYTEKFVRKNQSSFSSDKGDSSCSSNDEIRNEGSEDEKDSDQNHTFQLPDWSNMSAVEIYDTINPGKKKRPLWMRHMIIAMGTIANRIIRLLIENRHINPHVQNKLAPSKREREAQRFEFSLLDEEGLELLRSRLKSDILLDKPALQNDLKNKRPHEEDPNDQLAVKNQALKKVALKDERELMVQQVSIERLRQLEKRINIIKQELASGADGAIQSQLQENLNQLLLQYSDPSF
jgi:hypothetical protein